MVKTAVVILNWNGAEMMRRFLPGVLKNTPEAEVWVADNASTDDSLRMLSEEFAEVKTIALDQNWGFAEGYNKALAQIEAEYYVLLNSDVEVGEKWLSPLVTFLDANDDVAAVQPKLLKYDDGSEGAKARSHVFEYAGAAGGFVDKYGYPYCRGRVFGVVEEDHGQYDAPIDIHWATGACMVVRAADYWKAGALDARFFAHNEEIDLCWRLRIMGKRIVCLPQSKVWHLGGGTLPQGNPRKTYLNFRNNLTMLYKNLPEERLAPVMRMRRWLDYVAALQALLTGHMGDVRAIMKARRDFNEWKKGFKPNRDMIQTNRKLQSDKDLSPLSVLWQFHVLGRKKWSVLRTLSLLFVMLLACASAQADDKTRGIGVYPGRLSESYAVQVETSQEYRNLALYHTAYHSSCFDYNLTAHLTTDGLMPHTALPYLETCVNGKLLEKRQREWSIDGNEWSNNVLLGEVVDLDLNWRNMTIEADSVMIYYTVAYEAGASPKGFVMRIMDGDQLMAQETTDGLPGVSLGYTISSDPNKQYDSPGDAPARKVEKGFCLNTREDGIHSFNLHMELPGAIFWKVKEIKFFCGGEPVDTRILPSSRFQSGWMSAEGGQQWLYVDLGGDATFDKVTLNWLAFAPQGRLETSDDAKDWTLIAPLPTTDGLAYSIPVVQGHGRYVRVALEGSSDRYQLAEMQVYGRGGTMAMPHAEAAVMPGRWSLDGGDWRLMRASEVEAGGEKVSAPGFDTKGWLPATVPGTVLTSFVNAGAVPDQNYDDNVFYTSESFFNGNFWYRREFVMPQSFEGKNIYLNLDGINWKANVWLNGKKVGRVEGAFTRGKIALGDALVKGTNVLAIEIERVAHPAAVKEKYTENTDYNGGLLGWDNPTFHATVGWDWINSVRGRDIGIWNDVVLTAESGLSLSDPLIMSHLTSGVGVGAKTGVADLCACVYINNVEKKPVSGKLCGWIGDVKFEKQMTIATGETQLQMNPEACQQLKNQKLNLWWPNGYGTPYLYDAGFAFVGENGDTLSVINFKQGIREMSYTDRATKLKIYVNGHRVVPLGGNWGFSEQNLNYRGREYDIAVRNHADMNFNMIRNWVGQTGDDEFYEACDRHGVMVWQDFWLANPADGPDPKDEKMFMANAVDMVKRIRHHASVALYCGRNEGYPPKTLDDALANLVETGHPSMVYISSSADDGVSGHGPYRAISAKEYFENQSGQLHSERGMPNVMTYEGLTRTLRPEHLWPQNTYWGQHDYTMAGAQRGTTFNELIAKYGDIQSAEQFTKLAQFVNYDGYRAMYESGSKERMGLLIWMSHACWPSMVWQCYDYYFEPTAAYFGCKKACEPLHIQYNASTRKVEVVNLGVGTRKKLKARIDVLNLEGKVMQKYEMKVDSEDDATVSLPAELALSDSEVRILRLSLADGKEVVSVNTYILTGEDGDYRTLSDMPKSEMKKSVKVSGQTAEVTLQSSTTTLLVRLNLKDANGEQILPVHYSDNYFHLLPGERRTIRVKWDAEDQHTDDVTVEVTSFN